MKNITLNTLKKMTINMYYQILIMNHQYLGIHDFPKQNKYYLAVIWPSIVKKTMSEPLEEYLASSCLL